MTLVLDQAEAQRAQSLEKALAHPGIREPTRRGMRKVDQACRRITESRMELTVANVVRALEEMYPGDHPAQQSIHNHSTSGNSYREVIAIWRTFQDAVAKTRKVRVPSHQVDDLPDIVLNQIEPEGARMVVLAMRTALRNMRRQMQTIRAISPDRLVRHQDGQVETGEVAELALSAEEKEVVRAFLDPTETASRSLHWDDLGRLMDDERGALSRPGLSHVLEKIADVPKTAGTLPAPRPRRRKRATFN